MIKITDTEELDDLLSTVDIFSKSIEEVSPGLRMLGDIVTGCRQHLTDIVEVLDTYGTMNGHETWCIDQVMRIALGTRYQQWRDERKVEGLPWEEGVAP